MFNNLRNTIKGWNLLLTGGVAFITTLTGFVLLFRNNAPLVFLIAIIIVDFVIIVCCIFIFTSKTSPQLLGRGKPVFRFPRYRRIVPFAIVILLAVNVFLISLPFGQKLVSEAIWGTSTPTLAVEGRVGTGTTRLFVEPQPSNQIHVVLNLYFYKFFITATPSSNETAIFVTQTAPLPRINATTSNPNATPPIALQGSNEGGVNLYSKMIAVLECPKDGSVLGCSEQIRDIGVTGQQVEPAWDWYLDVTSEKAVGKSIIVRLYGATSKGERLFDTPLWQTSFLVNLQSTTPDPEQMTATAIVVTNQAAEAFLNMTNTAVVEIAIAQTQTAAAPTASPTLNDTPTPTIQPTYTPTPELPTLDPTQLVGNVLLTQVASNATGTALAAQITPTVVALDQNAVAATGTALAILLGQGGGGVTEVAGVPTQEIINVVPTRLPESGFFDDVGNGSNVGLIALLALGLVGVIGVSRLVRASNK